MDKCTKCGLDLSTKVVGYFGTPQGAMCEDCYFNGSEPTPERKLRDMVLRLANYLESAADIIAENCDYDEDDDWEARQLIQEARNLVKEDE